MREFFEVRLPLFFAQCAPRWLVRWCFVRLVAEVSCEHPTLELPSIYAVDALRMWDDLGKP